MLDRGQRIVPLWDLLDNHVWDESLSTTVVLPDAVWRQFCRVNTDDDGSIEAIPAKARLVKDGSQSPSGSLPAARFELLERISAGEWPASTKSAAFAQAVEGAECALREIKLNLKRAAEKWARAVEAIQDAASGATISTSGTSQPDDLTDVAHVEHQSKEASRMLCDWYERMPQNGNNSAAQPEQKLQKAQENYLRAACDGTPMHEIKRLAEEYQRAKSQAECNTSQSSGAKAREKAQSLSEAEAHIAEDDVKAARDAAKDAEAEAASANSQDAAKMWKLWTGALDALLLVLQLEPLRQFMQKMVGDSASIEPRVQRSATAEEGKLRRPLEKGWLLSTESVEHAKAGVFRIHGALHIRALLEHEYGKIDRTNATKCPGCKRYFLPALIGEHRSACTATQYSDVEPDIMFYLQDGHYELRWRDPPNEQSLGFYLVHEKTCELCSRVIPAFEFRAHLQRCTKATLNSDRGGFKLPPLKSTSFREPEIGMVEVQPGETAADESVCIEGCTQISELYSWMHNRMGNSNESIGTIVKVCKGSNTLDKAKETAKIWVNEHLKKGDENIVVKKSQLTMKPEFVPLRGVPPQTRALLEAGFVIAVDDKKKDGTGWEPVPERTWWRAAAFAQYDLLQVKAQEVSNAKDDIFASETDVHFFRAVGKMQAGKTGDNPNPLEGKEAIKAFQQQLEQFERFFDEGQTDDVPVRRQVKEYSVAQWLHEDDWLFERVIKEHKSSESLRVRRVARVAMHCMLERVKKFVNEHPVCAQDTVRKIRRGRNHSLILVPEFSLCTPWLTLAYLGLRR